MVLIVQFLVFIYGEFGFMIFSSIVDYLSVLVFKQRYRFGELCATQLGLIRAIYKQIHFHEYNIKKILFHLKLERFVSMYVRF